MEEIVIPSTEYLQHTTKETVDRFSLLGRILLNSTKKNRDFLKTSKYVLKTVSRQTVNVDNIFGILGEITLTLATDYLNKNDIRISENRPSKNLESQVIAIDEAIIQETKKIDALTKEHTRLVRKLMEAQKVFWKLDNKTQKCRVSIEKAQSSRFFLKMADGKPNEKIMKRLQKTYFISKRASDQAEHFFYRLVEHELAMRKDLKLMNENLVIKIKDKVTQHLDNALDDLRQVVELFPQNVRTEKCLQMLRDVDKASIAEKVVDVTSKTYYCPKVMGYEDIHGYTNVTKSITMDIEKQKTTGFKLVTGLIQDTTTKVSVDNSVSKVPGVMALKKGMKIRQMLGFGDLELAFGYHRQGLVPLKKWGFFKTDLTRTY